MPLKRYTMNFSNRHKIGIQIQYSVMIYIKYNLRRMITLLLQVKGEVSQILLSPVFYVI